MKKTLFIFWVLTSVFAKAQHKVIVDKNGQGDFTSIQTAINSLADTSSADRIIYIKAGVYDEKIFIEKNHVILEGENREKTVITQSIARDEFRCSHKDDWGAATMNVNGDDVTIKNITIKNTFGFDFVEEKNIDCFLDTITHKKRITKTGHQMALRTIKATRLKALNCSFVSLGGDTVSPWNVENGMFYFKNCSMEGGVDFYCPRGWAWAEDCQFYAYGGPASVWHDGSKNVDSKSVMVHCSFKGYDGFLLGRYHRDAQMFFVNCAFADNMKDSAVYHVPNSTATPFGQRIYFYNCHRSSGDFSWFKDHLPDGITEKNITINWVFHNTWNPENQ